jgi:hypothetical protein
VTGENWLALAALFGPGALLLIVAWLVKKRGNSQKEHTNHPASRLDGAKALPPEFDLEQRKRFDTFVDFKAHRPEAIIPDQSILPCPHSEIEEAIVCYLTYLDVLSAEFPYWYGLEGGAAAQHETRVLFQFIVRYTEIAIEDQALVDSINLGREHDEDKILAMATKYYAPDAEETEARIKRALDRYRPAALARYSRRVTPSRPA